MTEAFDVSFRLYEEELDKFEIKGNGYIKIYNIFWVFFLLFMIITKI